MCAEAGSLHRRCFGRVALVYSKNQSLRNEWERSDSYGRPSSKAWIRFNRWFIQTFLCIMMHDHQNSDGAA